MRTETYCIIFLLVLCTFLLGGCFSSNPEDIKAFIKPYERQVSADRYILQPPDEIEIYCSKVPEIHLKKQRIRPDGVVSFEAIGELQAAGKTAKQLADNIHEKLLNLYALASDNPVDVTVAVYRSKVYYVLGQVYFEGPKIYTGRDTALRALAESRVTPLAWVERIQIIRPSSDPVNSKPRIFELNFDRMSAHGDLSKDILLQEGDIIYVPPTVLAAIGMKVEELLSPIARAFGTVNIVSGQPTYRD